MLYAVMLSFQLTGALLLLINSCRGSKSEILKGCFPGSNIVERNENDEVVIPKKKMQQSAKRIYMNMVSFGDLVIGYGVATFSPEANMQTSHIAFIMALLLIVLLLIENGICALIAKRKFPDDYTVRYEELEEYGVDTTVTESEIEDLFND